MEKFEIVKHNKSIFENFLENNLEKNSNVKKFAYAIHKLVGHKNPNTTVHIGVGKLIDGCFHSFLSTEVKEPIVVLSCYDSEPQFVIKTVSSTNVTINLALISNMEFTQNDNQVLETVEVYFRYNNEIDYHINVSTRK